MTEKLCDKLSREADLLKSLPSEIPSGISEAVSDAWHNKGHTLFEAASTVALGTVFTLLSRNPNPMVKSITRTLGYSFAGLAAADMGSRFYGPMHDTWQNPDNLGNDKKWLGSNVSNAIFNYGMAIVGGGVGAHFGERFLETTKFGEFLSAQKVTHFDGSEAPQESPSGKNSINASSFIARSDLEIKPNMQYTLRQFHDGSSLLQSSDGNAVFKPSGGQETWFSSQQNWWSAQPSVRVFTHKPGSAEDLLGRSQLPLQFLPRIKAEPEISLESWETKGKIPFDISGYLNKAYPWEKGSEGGIGALASQWALERAGDIGTSILQEKLVPPHKPDSKDKKDKKTS